MGWGRWVCASSLSSGEGKGEIYDCTWHVEARFSRRARQLHPRLQRRSEHAGLITKLKLWRGKADRYAGIGNAAEPQLGADVGLTWFSSFQLRLPFNPQNHLTLRPNLFRASSSWFL